MKLLGDLRSVLGIGLVWGALWAVIAIILGAILEAVDPGTIQPGEEPIVLAPVIALVGFICGVVFSALLIAFEKGNSILDLPLIRVAVWGTLVAATLPLVAGKGIPEMLVTVPLGAVSAIASVAIVRTWSALPATR